MTYRELLDKHHKEVNDFSSENIVWVFGTIEDVENELTKNDLSLNDVVSIGDGGYLKKDKVEDFNTLTSTIRNERLEYTLNNLYEVLLYEFNNHELEINLSYGYQEFLIDVIGLSEDDVVDNKIEINKAIEDYRKYFYEQN